MRTFLVISLLILASCKDRATSVAPTTATSDVAPEAPPLRKVKVLVVPFQNGMTRDFDYFSIGFALSLTGRLEEISSDDAMTKACADAGFRLEAVAGPDVLLEGQVRLRRDAKQAVDGDGAFRLAKAEGAAYVLTGKYEGRVEDWRLTVELYEVGPTGLVMKSRQSGAAVIYAGGDAKPRPAHPGVQIGAAQALLADRTAAALRDAGVVLPTEAVLRLGQPEAPPAMAFIHLSRAYKALMLEEGDAAVKKARELSGLAVNAWPQALTARRFHARMLAAAGMPDKAISQYRIALEASNQDVRTLTALGTLEVSQKAYDDAVSHLGAAVALRPADPAAHFHLAEALVGLGEDDKAVVTYERARQLAPDDVEIRRRLAALYSARREFLKAADELRFIVERVPDDLEAVFTLAACLRAGGRLDLAVDAYLQAEGRFPTEARLPLFRGDLLVRLGRTDESDGAYDRAKAIRPGIMRDGLANGFVLLDFLSEAMGTDERMSAQAAVFRDAANDAVRDLRLSPKEACDPSRAPASVLLAAEAGDGFLADGRLLQRHVVVLRKAQGDGGVAFLTLEERAAAERLVSGFGALKRALAEDRAMYRRTLLPMLRRRGCSLDGAVAADIAVVRARNADRVVTLDPYKPSAPAAISPDIPIGARRIVTFTVRTPKDATEEYVLTLDGKAFSDAIPPGAGVEFRTTFGRHDFCLLAKSDPRPCGAPTTVRSTFFYAKLVIR